MTSRSSHPHIFSVEIKSLVIPVFALLIAPGFLHAEELAGQSASIDRLKNLTFSLPAQSPAPSSPAIPAPPSLFANLAPTPAASPATPSESPSPVVSASPSASPFPAQAASPAATPPVIAARDSAVVQPSRLILLLPESPPGWSSDKPEGSTSESEGFAITTVGCVYVKGDADNAPTATINIIDSANNQQFQDATKAMWSAPSDTPAGYDKTITVAGLPGFEHYSNPDKTGVLWVVVGGRYFVQVETTNQPPSELEGWLTRIDLKKLAKIR